MEQATASAPTAARNGHEPDRLTGPTEYGALNAVYGTLLASLIVAARERAREHPPIPAAELVPLGAATFALSKVIAKEKMGTWVREPFVEESPERKPEAPRGRGFRHAVGELLTCTRCVGAWSALGLVSLRIVSPPAGRVVTTVLATSAANDFLQAGFQFVTGKANQAQS